MNLEEFLVDKKEETEIEETNTSEDTPDEEIIETENLDVQKAVVESLAAEKIEQQECIEKLNNEKAELEATISKLELENNQFKSQFDQLKGEIDSLKTELEKLSQQLISNEERPLSNQVALLDREDTLNEKFSGEFRDHVIEVIKEARDLAEKDGRLRRAQILESVLVANESSGQLDDLRKKVDNIFNENQNVINGTVIEELNKLGFSHKNGEEYLLPAEIIKRYL